MRAIVTVYGMDKVGIMYGVCRQLAEFNINILDISQTVMQDIFTMTMLVDTAQANVPFEAVRSALDAVGRERQVSIRIQSEEIFNAMHIV